MAVCQAWRNVIRGTPKFWCPIYVNRRVEWFVECLERSQPLPVDVTFQSPAINLPHALNVLHPHNNRITSLVFRQLHCAQITGNRLVLGEWPRLKTLKVVVDHNHAADSTEHLIIGSYPVLVVSHPGGLQEVRVDGMLVDTIHPAALSSLRDLMIGGCAAARKHVRLAGFIGMLNACVSLEKLHLGPTSLDTVIFDLPQNVGPRVRLPRLRDLFISGKVEEVSNLLSHMEVRDDVNIWVETDDQEDIDRAAVAPRNILPNNIPACAVDILKSATRILVDTPNGPYDQVSFVTATRGMNLDHKINIVVRVSDERGNARDGTASLDAQALYFLNALRHLPAMFPSAPVDTIVCNAELDAVDEETWRSTLSSFPMLRTLVISDLFCGDLRPLCRALMSPQSTVDQRPVCCDLEYIWVRNACGALDRLAVLRECIVWRTDRDAPLSRLHLELSALVGHHEVPPDAYQAAFRDLVRECYLDIQQTTSAYRGPDGGVIREFPFDS